MTTQTYAPGSVADQAAPLGITEVSGGPAADPVEVILDGQTVSLQGEAAAAVRDVLAHFARGQGVVIGGVDDLLTTVKTAELTGVSRTPVCNLMDRDELPYRHVGNHRRVRAADAIAHMGRQPTATRDALDEVAALANRHDLYSDDV